VLERDALVQAHEERGHVGRPALVYRLTEHGDALYPKLYDSLASVLLNELRTIAGADALQKVLRRVASRFAEPYMDRVEGRPLAERDGTNLSGARLPRRLHAAQRRLVRQPVHLPLPQRGPLQQRRLRHGGGLRAAADRRRRAPGEQPPARGPLLHLPHPNSGRCRERTLA
jgi:hypothetical protein